jgi:DnaJ-class molecular chaperone
MSITIIHKLDDCTILECARCDGSGKMQADRSGSHTPDCDVCDTKGKIKIEKTPPFVECSHCGGGGGDVRTCGLCQGTGVNLDAELETY